MTYKKKDLKAAAERFAQVTDAVLIEVGRAAEKRQRRRAIRAGLKKAGKAALVAGATAATVYAARAVRKARAR
ncbi:MAG TPA: hypothetical protein VI160_07955 [Gemmatimonadales bacterium]